MITFTRTTRVILVAATALAVAAPVASAKPLALRPARAGAPSASYQGTYRPVDTNVKAAPDVVDRVGTINQVTGIHALPVATTRTIVSSGSFDWTAAAIGAGFVASAVLLGAGALGFRGRRRMALGV